MNKKPIATLLLIYGILILWTRNLALAPLAAYALISTVLAFPRYVEYWIK